MFVVVLAFFGFGYMHEQVHVSIYESYGVESSVQYFSNFPDLTTTVDHEDYLEYCNDNCKLAHNINEAVSYPLMVMFAFLMVAFFLLLTELFFIEKLLAEKS